MLPRYFTYTFFRLQNFVICSFIVNINGYGLAPLNDNSHWFFKLQEVQIHFFLKLYFFFLNLFLCLLAVYFCGIIYLKTYKSCMFVHMHICMYLYICVVVWVLLWYTCERICIIENLKPSACLYNRTTKELPVNNFPSNFWRHSLETWVWVCIYLKSGHAVTIAPKTGYFIYS